IGSDSHTPTAGGLGMLAIGAGGIDVAVAMGGGAYYIAMPKVIEVHLTGALAPWVSAKDAILHLLGELTVRGGVGKIFEFTGPGVATLSVPERCTITNLCTELGATTGIFPSDERTLEYLDAVGRPQDYVPVGPDEGASYDGRLTLDLSAVEPMIAIPSMPDKVVPVTEVAGVKVQQVLVGSCTNGSFTDMMTVAQIVKGRRVHPETHAIVVPASRNAYELLVKYGAAADLLEAGVDLSEATCGPCIGVGHVPASDSVSLRTFNRNFRGRSGLEDDRVYLSSPETAAASALFGEIVDPRSLAGEAPRIVLPAGIAHRGIISPPKDAGDPSERETPLERGPNIAPVPLGRPVPEHIECEVLLVVGDNISTDHIMPARSDILQYRSNIPKLAEYTFCRIDEQFASRASEKGGGVIVAGENYGQGSSREHAALAPSFLGVQAVIAKSFARIHRSNLINFGVLPLRFGRSSDYEKLKQGDRISIRHVRESLVSDPRFVLVNLTRGSEMELFHDLSAREIAIVRDGGVLRHMRTAAAVSS